MTEAQLQEQVATYLRMQYPDVLFHSDFGSGIKLTPGQAAKQKRQNGGRRAWPDMFIAQPKLEHDVALTDCDDQYIEYLGLFLELKREGTRLCHKFYEMATVDRAKIAELEAKVKVYEAILENSNFKMAVLKDKKTGGER